jgi:hypothetical protein
MRICEQNKYMPKALVFATSLIDSDPPRYQGWIDYYTEFFRGLDVDLLLINDGPVEAFLNFRDVQQLILQPKLGRISCWKFPGWKRSFYYGLQTSRIGGYKYVAHVESDCFVHIRGREEFLDHLFNPGYYTPFCKSYNFPETALQILNEPWVTNYFIDRYSCEENWHEDIDFEHMVLKTLHPNYILNGDRWEGKKERFNPEYNFLTGCTAPSFVELFKV